MLIPPGILPSLANLSGNGNDCRAEEAIAGRMRGLLLQNEEEELPFALQPAEQGGLGVVGGDGDLGAEVGAQLGAGYHAVIINVRLVEIRDR